MNEEYTYDIGKYTIGVDKNGEDGIGLTVAIINDNGEIHLLGNCYGDNARCIDLLIKENQKLKEQLEECQLQNFNLREDIMIKKMSFPSKEIKDKSFLELYDMLSYEDLKNKSEQLKEQLQQKEDIINEITNYCKFQIEKEQDKFPKPIESEEWLKGRISAFEEILDNKGE